MTLKELNEELAKQVKASKIRLQNIRATSTYIKQLFNYKDKKTNICNN